jgi:hypothetical protein
VAVPAAARAHTPAGAEAFVRHYLAQVNIAWTKPQTGLLPPLSDPGCLSCQAFEATAADLVKKGQKYSSAPASITKVTAYGGAPEGEQFVRVQGEQHKVDVIDAQGRVVLTDAKKQLALDALVAWRGSGWVLYDMG